MCTYERLGTYDPDHVLSFVDTNRRNRYPFGEFNLRMDSQRYQLFAQRRTCVACGLVGTVMALERHRHGNNKNPHFNLYGEVDGHEVMLTKDHIVPKSKGGSNHLSNYQVMCSECNGVKKDNQDLTLREIQRIVDLRRSFQRSNGNGSRHLMETYRELFGEGSTTQNFEIFTQSVAKYGELVQTTNKKKPILYLAGVFVVMDRKRTKIQRMYEAVL